MQCDLQTNRLNHQALLPDDSQLTTRYNYLHSGGHGPWAYKALYHPDIY